LQILKEEARMNPRQYAIKEIGRPDPKRHLEDHAVDIIAKNILQTSLSMVDSMALK
jgi:26S proteasome regulatory subunit N11